jgi:UDPglucose--hexose-1-phosphate uridylyltransferase
MSTMTPAAPAVPHRRYNPLLDEWVLCSPTRLARPWQGQVETPPVETRPPYDPGCYLCPGNSRAGGRRNPAYTATFAFDNDYPALGMAEPGMAEPGMAEPGTAEPGLTDHGEAPAEDPLLRAHPEAGLCRVLCFSPRHDLTLADLETSGLRAVVDAWAEEVRALAARPKIRHVQVFENKGAMMGCSNPHPHGQIWATEHVPSGPARRLAAQRAYMETHGRDLLGDYLRRELSAQERLVFRNDHWVALVPFWAVWPFETMLLPLRAVGDLPGLRPEERDSLADAVSRLNRRYDNLFLTPFPYSMAWHARPTTGEHPYWRLHAGWYPPLLRSPEIRKFVVGYELAAESQRDLTPEEAAARLRAMPERPLAAAVGAAPPAQACGGRP